MPWQRMVADVGGELGDDGLPVWKEVIVTVPRQSGKTTIVLAWMIQRALGWGGPQSITYSAQKGKDAREKLINDWLPVLLPRKAKLGIFRITKGAGGEGVEFRNLSRVGLLASSEDSGHGKTLDLGVCDELWQDTSHYRAQSMGPAMLTRPAAQMFIASTAGTDASVALNAAVERGRLAVETGAREGTAYFEWSMPDGCELDNPAHWSRWMPALGFTQSEATIRHAMSLVPLYEERLRAFGNIATKATDRVFPADVWAAVCSPDAAVEPERGVAFAVDANPERSAAAIFVSGGTTVEQAEFRPGTGWVVERLVEMAQRWSAPVGLDPAGPAGVFVRELERAGVKVVDVAGRDMLQACGAFYDAVTERRVTIRTSGDLDAAVAGAVRRQVGDAWVWARRSSAVDVCPLVAATIALDVAGRAPAPVHQWF